MAAAGTGVGVGGAGVAVGVIVGWREEITEHPARISARRGSIDF
jgi:hypothetical protein